MPIDFPNSAITNDTYTYGGKTWVYNGEGWALQTNTVVISNLDDILDVVITTPADNDLLAYDTGTSKWINQTAAQAAVATSTHTHGNITNTGAIGSTANLVTVTGTSGVLTTATATNQSATTFLRGDLTWVTPTDTYPTTFTWTGGTTAGPTGSLTGSGMSAVSYAAIPSASVSASGIITTGAQVLSGAKTFRSSAAFDGVTIDGRAAGTGTFAVTITPTTLTASRTFTLPDVTGTAITTGDTGTVTNTMLAGSIANTKLLNSAITINSASTSLGGTVTLYAGTTTLQTSSANQGLTGISSIALPGATSGTITLSPTATAGTNTITLPAITGTALVTSGTTATAGYFDTGTTNPTGTTRLNYGGYLYATRLYSDNILPIGSTVTLTGGFTVTGAAAFNGGFSVDTTAFSVADVTGNTSIAGTLNVTGKANIVYDTVANAGNYGVIYAGTNAPSSPVTGDIWIDNSSANPNSNILRWRKLATAGQTSITGLDDNNNTLSYVAGYEQVYINGVLIYRGTDYTATNGTSITISSGLYANDTIEIIAPIFTYSGDYYTQGQSDAKYATISNPTFTGTVTIPTASISAITASAGYIGEVISSRSTTTQTGTLSGNLVGNATITLTPGTWLVQATASVLMASGSAADGVSCGINNNTTSIEVSNSRGAADYSSTTISAAVSSMQMAITVASNTVYAPLICRNGSSTVGTYAGAGAAANAIVALRIR